VVLSKDLERRQNSVIITRERIVHYWSKGPERDYRPGFIRLNGMGALPFPDVATLSPTEKDALRPVLQAHPEYLLEVHTSKVVQ
jgi:hypothetical protein